MRKKMCAAAVVTALMLTGCGAGVPDLSHVNNDIAAQYVADALLRNDKHYDEGLDYDHSLLKPTPTPVPTPAPVKTEKPSSGKTDGSGKNRNSGQSASLTSVSVSEIYGVKGISVTPTSYQLKNSYGSSVYQIMPRGKGNKLAVVYFNVSNKLTKAKRVNLTKRSVSAELIVNGQSVGSPLLSFADNDLQNWNMTVGAGQKKQGVLLFEIDKKTKVSDVKIHFTTSQKEATSSVK